jgi:transposase-like protein
MTLFEKVFENLTLNNEMIHHEGYEDHEEQLRNNQNLAQFFRNLRVFRGLISYIFPRSIGIPISSIINIGSIGYIHTEFF